MVAPPKTNESIKGVWLDALLVEKVIDKEL
jgi:hypothetical protein